MSTLAVDIKTKLKAILDALKVAGTLGEVQEDDFKKDIYERDFSAFPAAVITSPAIIGTAETNRENMREHVFDIVVFMKGENVASATAVETLIETMLDALDNQPSLTGSANGGMFPSSSQPEAMTSRSGSFIVFHIIIRARAIKSLTFSS